MKGPTDLANPTRYSILDMVLWRIPAPSKPVSTLLQKTPSLKAGGPPKEFPGKDGSLSPRAPQTCDKKSPGLPENDPIPEEAHLYLHRQRVSIRDTPHDLFVLRTMAPSPVVKSCPESSFRACFVPPKRDPPLDKICFAPGR